MGIYIVDFMALGQSPYIETVLISSIQRVACQVGDLPEDQITLRALRDVNVPKFLKAVW